MIVHLKRYVLASTVMAAFVVSGVQDSFPQRRAVSPAVSSPRFLGAKAGSRFTNPTALRDPGRTMTQMVRGSSIWGGKSPR